MNTGKEMLLTVLLAMPFTALAGPFGLEKGMTLEEVKKITNLNEVNPYIYRTSYLPKEHPVFTNYILTIHPEKGLCSISSTSERMSLEKVKFEFFTIRELISSKYGKGLEKDNDFDDKYTARGNDELWMLKKRTLRPTTTWINHPLYQKELPQDIYMITLSINHSETEVGNTFLGLHYQLEKNCLLTTQNKEKPDNSIF